MRREASAANNVPLCIWRMVWWSLFVILCKRKTWEQLQSVAHVANMTSLQDIISTSQANCNQNTLYIDFIMLSHQVHVLKLMPKYYYITLNCLMHLHGVKIWAPNCNQPQPIVIGFVLACTLATLAGNQPSLGSPVVLRYFNWLVKLLTRTVGFCSQQPLQQDNFQSSSQCT